MTQDEKSRWLTQERARRQSRQQTTATTQRVQQDKERQGRILEARGYESVERKR